MIRTSLVRLFPNLYVVNYLILYHFIMIHSLQSILLLLPYFSTVILICATIWAMRLIISLNHKTQTGRNKSNYSSWH